MDVSLNRRRKKVNIVENELKFQYPLDISIYLTPPSCSISFEEFQDFALNRLKLLRVLEVAGTLGKKILSHEWKEYVMQELNSQKLRNYVKLLKSDGGSKNPSEHELEARREDYISHYILKLAYCKSMELRKWFLSREVDLFKWRFLNLSEQASCEFLKLNKMEYETASEDEKNQYREELIDSTAGNFVFEHAIFYKLPWYEVPSLIEHRKVFLRGGIAYVPHYELVSVVAATYRTNLSESMTKASKTFNSASDIRIGYFLKHIHQSYVGNDYAATTDRAENITATNLKTYAQHFPLCMKTIFDVFSTKHHLKHGARLQYMLFLKGTGMLFEDMMQYWRDEFTKLIDEQQFEKKYAYSVKHVYGKVGKMYSHPAYSCRKIIRDVAGSGDCHGCPFAQWDAEYFGSKLFSLGLKAEAVAEITKYKHQGHYQIACTKYFEHMHDVKDIKPIEHPNQYFDESLSLKTGEKDGKAKMVQKKQVANNVNNKGGAAKEDMINAMDDIDESVFLEDDFPSTSVSLSK